ncbi:CRISPR-associated RAMP protein, Cmr4 family [Methanococcus vannielii SB]|uniref:CRISPR-associated RAMP protein, Cmr4 family n=1 Tax=Methanococcus vannielii (strain ATCC 35089 / DSM 1224 / JCM 13029 / OCM 148 / SB) TaxID=406327 RepID=A6UNE9_METVS|nr:type III-B CRISPR module RAMP protein Cmr4 [Methanococcus vannielii]ABR54021.1 CRISPR-associated RAMP protein, Cmr4 family [Methanococcus vannielii SB]
MDVKKELYIIEAITNMHVGSGDANFGIIDKTVQRDVLTGFPAIYSSSLKGSLRDYFVGLKSEKTGINDLIIDHIFGKEGNNENGSIQGKYKFFEAKLLGLPVRSNKRPYLIATCPQILNDFLESAKIFASELSNEISDLGTIDLLNGEIFVNGKIDDEIIEGHKVESSANLWENLEKLLGNDFVIFSNEKFMEICAELPVIARNKLDNGESKNLWYEEIIPRKTKFYFGVDLGSGEYNNKFTKNIDDKIVQIGGNATIGYGFAKLENLSKVLK